MLTRAVVLDLDETLVLTSNLEALRKERKWKKVYESFSLTSIPHGTQLFLETISALAHVGIVTKSPRPYAEKLLQYHHINLPVLVAYYDVKRIKPDPEALLLAAEKLRVQASDCIYVGDDAADVQAAYSANFTPIGICWGPPVEMGLKAVCTSWNQVQDAIVQHFESK